MSRLGVLPKVNRILAIAALCALGACADRQPTEPDPAASGSLLGGPSLSSPTLIECPSNETTKKEAPIGALGGTIAIGGTNVVFPAGALPGLTTVTLTIPASRYVEIDIEAHGVKYFPVDAQPIVTIDYARCARADVLAKPLTAWYIDSDSKALLQKMETSVDNKLTRSVTFTTDHFSGYAIAF